jgi:hypothetical protein
MKDGHAGLGGAVEPAEELDETELLVSAGARPVRVHERGGGAAGRTAVSSTAARQLRLEIRPRSPEHCGGATPGVDVTHLRSEAAQATPSVHYRAQGTGLINTDAQIGVRVGMDRFDHAPKGVTANTTRRNEAMNLKYLGTHASA